jgi:hypothetical protein
MTDDEQPKAKDCSDRRYRDCGGFCTIAGMGWPPCFTEGRDGNPKCNMGAPDVEETHEKARQRRIREIAKCTREGKPIPIF